MKLFGDYQNETHGREMIEISGRAFATFEVRGQECYIVDIFVEPNSRRNGVARELADKIVQAALAKGCTHLIGTTFVRSSTAHLSIGSMLSYGFRPIEAKNDFIFFRKDILNG